MQASRTLLDGIYSEEQATAGRTFFTRTCVPCHGANLLGGVGGGAPIAGNAFLRKWDGKPFAELFEYTRTMMPIDRPGSLSADQTANVLAYVLQYNKFPAGEEMPKTKEELQGITFVRPDQPAAP